MKLPDELNEMIYNESDFFTKINLNKAFNWSFYSKNPLKHIFVIPKKQNMCKCRWIAFGRRTQTIISRNGDLMLMHWLTVTLP